MKSKLRKKELVSSSSDRSRNIRRFQVITVVQVLIRSSARAAMQIATVVIFAALLTSTAALHADPAAESPEMLRTPATPKLLFVLEYDSFVDWEAVTLEQGVTDGVLAWMMQLQDRLTLTTQTPLGEKLLVCLSAMILYKSMLPL